MATLSVIVITKNEEKNISECLESVRWADEIIVVDAESSDSTVEKARMFTQKVFLHAWIGFGEAKNFGLSKCSGEWVLWLDADERVTEELRAEICSAIAGADPGTAAFSMPRHANFLGRWIDHCGWYPGRVVRLFRISAATFSNHIIHEKLDVRGKILHLRSDLLHYTDPNLEHYYEKFNRYTSLASDELKMQKKTFGILKLIFDPLWVFLKMYVFRMGFLDGIPGLILSALSANYVFTKYAKLWELSRKGG
ncbi:MAG: glycosyltransferase family 2 protein [Bacteroidota bacterium]